MASLRPMPAFQIPTTKGKASPCLAALLSAWLFVFASPAVQALESVEVFTDPALFPVTNANIGLPVEIHDLSTMNRFLEAMGQGLPGNDPAQAKVVATARLAQPEIRQCLASGLAASARASQYGISKIPAIVFDHGAAVVYGLADVGQAVQLYRQWREGQ